MKKVYAYLWPKPDFASIILDVTTDGLTLNTLEGTVNNAASFLRQGENESYVDKWGVIHEVTAHEDKPLVWYFEVTDDCWEEILGTTGALLDDSENKDMPEEIRAGFADVYAYAYDKVFPDLNDKERRRRKNV